MFQNIYYTVADRSDEQINSFLHRYDYVSQEQIETIFKIHWYNLECIEKSESWWTAHIVYFVIISERKERLVFRANWWEKWGFHSPEFTMLSEKIVTDTLSLLWIPSNIILHVDISRKLVPFDYQIEKELLWIDPELYIDEKWFFSGTQQDYDQLSFELWSMIAQYSNIIYSWYGLPKEELLCEWKIIWSYNTFYEYITTNLKEHLSYLIEKWFISTDEWEKIIQIFKNHKDRINDCDSCLVHHDLADHNIIFNPQWKNKLVWIFDWEAMVVGDPMLDLWSCPTWWTHFERKEKLIEWYKSVKSLPYDYEIRMNLYELRTWIWKLMFVHRMKFDNSVIEACKKWLRNVFLKL